MAETEITCRNHGPISIKGEFVLKDTEGNEFELSGRTNISLCRCGHSQNKPFCDGSHTSESFQSEIKARQI